MPLCAEWRHCTLSGTLILFLKFKKKFLVRKIFIYLIFLYFSFHLIMLASANNISLQKLFLSSQLLNTRWRYVNCFLTLHSLMKFAPLWWFVWFKKQTTGPLIYLLYSFQFHFRNKRPDPLSTCWSSTLVWMKKTWTLWKNRYRWHSVCFPLTRWSVLSRLVAWCMSTNLDAREYRRVTSSEELRMSLPSNCRYCIFTNFCG